MCNPNNWEQTGDADIDFARDKSNEMYISVLFDVIIPDVPIGTVVMWMSNVIPDNWLELGGQALSKTTYPELFDIFGYVHGGGSDIFVLPTYRGYSPYGAGADIDVQNKGGDATRTLAIETSRRTTTLSLIQDTTTHRSARQYFRGQIRAARRRLE